MQYVGYNSWHHLDPLGLPHAPPSFPTASSVPQEQALPSEEPILNFTLITFLCCGFFKIIFAPISRHQTTQLGFVSLNLMEGLSVTPPDVAFARPACVAGAAAAWPLSLLWRSHYLPLCPCVDRHLASSQFGVIMKMGCCAPVPHGAVS